MKEKEIISKEDARTIRTKRDLANALQDLLKEKRFDDIQIQEITDTALVSKHTFYNNFDDKNDLLLFLFRRYRDELLKQLRPIIERMTKAGTKPGAFVCFKKAVEEVVHFFYSADLPFQKMIRNDDSHILYWNLSLFVQEVLNELDYQYSILHIEKNENRVGNYFYSGACASMIYFSFLNGVDVDEKQIAKNIIKLAFPAVLD